MIGVIGRGQSVNINGCVQGGGWCTVAFSGGEGWVSSRYLSGDFDAGQIVVTEQPTAAVRVARPAATPVKRPASSPAVRLERSPARSSAALSVPRSAA